MLLVFFCFFFTAWITVKQQQQIIVIPMSASTPCIQYNEGTTQRFWGKPKAGRVGLAGLFMRGVWVTKCPFPVHSIPFKISQSFQWAGRGVKLGFQGGRRSETPPFKTSVETENNKLAGNLRSYPARPHWSWQRVISGVAHRSTCGPKKGAGPFR